MLEKATELVWVPWACLLALQVPCRDLQCVASGHLPAGRRALRPALGRCLCVGFCAVCTGIAYSQHLSNLKTLVCKFLAMHA